MPRQQLSAPFRARHHGRLTPSAVVSGVVRRLAALATSAALAIGGSIAPSAAGPVVAASPCSLGPNGAVHHVVYVQFDNTHLVRDNPNVPSDLEQMPHLLDFMRSNGTLLANDHTVLISHTAGGILSSLTGVYPDRHGQIVSNGNVRVGSSATAPFSFPNSFGYWTDDVSAAGTPTVPLMTTPTGTVAPAPWVPYTRAGCDVGAVATANTVLENTGTGPTGDITKVFGAGSDQWNETFNAFNPSGQPAAVRAKPQADFVGFAVHCTIDSPTCATGQQDLLPAEPGGYVGYKGLFGAQEIDPLLTGQPASTPVTGLDGNPVVDQFGNPGFPGFDGLSAAVSLGYTAELQEAGVPVTYSYISDAHDNHGTAGNAHIAYGPGSAGYVAQLKAYDDAFAAFFSRLASDGIDKSNTLFVFTVDEGDHFAGVTKTNCDGVTTPCVYDANEVGELNANIATLVANQFDSALAGQFQGATAPNAFTVHGDDAPTFYLAQKGVGEIGQNDPAARAFERAAANLTAQQLYTGELDHRLMVAMADQAEMKLLHMYTAGDPNRDPNFAYFADPDYFLTDFPASTCLTCINSAFAWNHGDIQPEIARTWLGFVGPGIQTLGQTGNVWTDHTDVRPTMLVDLGLADDYAHDGRAILEVLSGSAVPHQANLHRGSLQALGAAYKQLAAPFGALGMASLKVSTAGIVSGSASDDSVYVATQARLGDWLSRRDALASQIGTLLEGVQAGTRNPTESQLKGLAASARSLVAEVVAAAP
jgi:hypothetical protein